MSDIKTAGFMPSTEEGSFPVQFIENIEGDANMEMVVVAERKSHDIDVSDVSTRKEIKSGTSVAETLEIPSSGSHTIIHVGNAKEIFLGVNHDASDGACKIIPIGFSEEATEYDSMPLGEYTFAATSVEDTSGGGSKYMSHAQKIDCMGFPSLYFLVSEITGTSNFIYAWAWPVNPTVVE